VTYDFWLGRSASSLNRLADGLEDTEFTPDPLSHSTEFVWRVVANAVSGVTQGPAWSFTTVDSPDPNQPPSAPAPPITPADGSTILGVTATLTWSGGEDPDGDPVSYLVRFGTTNPPPNLRTVSTRSTQTPGILLFATTYFWQIVARDDHGHETPGPIWSFSTLGAPNGNPSAPCNLSPDDDAENVLVGTSFTWECGTDPDSDPVTFVIYLEENGGGSPDSVASTTERTYTPPAPLDYGSHYTWRVRARDNRGGQAISSAHSFDTENANQPPSSPCNPEPYDASTDTSPDDVRLRWGCGQDPDDDPETYDVYFGQTPDPTFLDSTGSRNYLLGGLEPCTLYYWKIVARDNRGGITEGPVWSFTTRGCPNQPPNVSCDPVPASNATEIAVNTTLSWGCTTDPDGDSVSCDVYLGTASDPPLVATVPDSSYTPPSALAEGTRYYWRIEARDEHGAVAASPVWHFDTVTAPPLNDPPSVPALPITPEDGASVIGVTTLLTWSGGEDPDGDPVSHLVRCGTANPPPDLRTVSVRSTLSPTLAFSTTYYWQIVARDDHGHDTPGPIWSFSTLGAPNQTPTAPCNLSPDDDSNDVPVGTSFTWECGTDPDSDPVTFVIYLEENGGGSPDSVATTTERTYTPPAPLANSSHYTWRVRARDNRGGQALSSLHSFDTEDANQPPSSPCNPNPYDEATDTSPDDVRLRWGCGQDPDDDPETYDVYFGLTTDPVFIDSTGARNYRVGDLEPYTVYYWKIVARDNRGGITEGPVWSFTTRAAGSPTPGPALDN
jgi:hypothetical protein